MELFWWGQYLKMMRLWDFTWINIDSSKITIERLFHWLEGNMKIQHSLPQNWLKDGKRNITKSSNKPSLDTPFDWNLMSMLLRSFHMKKTVSKNYLSKIFFIILNLMQCLQTQNCIRIRLVFLFFASNVRCSNICN